MTNPDTWLDKVQKLLAKAQDPNVTDAERDAYSAKAEELMVKYSIDAAIAQAFRIGQRDEILVKRIVVLNPYATSKTTLMFEIAEFFGCRAVRSQGWDYSTTPKTRTNVMTVVGYSQDIAKVELLYASLCIQLFSAIANTIIPPGEHGKTFRTALSIGFIDTVSLRLQEIRNRTIQEKTVETTGVALVLYNRDKEVERVLNSIFKKIRPGSGMRAKGSTGYEYGRIAGNIANLNQTGIGANRKRIGS